MDQMTPAQVRAFINEFGGPNELAKLLPWLNRRTPVYWHKIGRIPRWHWPDVTLAARKAKVKVPA